jgi:hypothetical protein
VPSTSRRPGPRAGSAPRKARPPACPNRRWRTWHARRWASKSRRAHQVQSGGRARLCHEQLGDPEEQVRARQAGGEPEQRPWVSSPHERRSTDRGDEEDQHGAGAGQRQRPHHGGHPVRAMGDHEPFDGWIRPCGDADGERPVCHDAECRRERQGSEEGDDDHGAASVPTPARIDAEPGRAHDESATRRRDTEAIVSAGRGRGCLPDPVGRPRAAGIRTTPRRIRREA